MKKFEVYTYLRVQSVLTRLQKEKRWVLALRMQISYVDTVYFITL